MINIILFAVFLGYATLSFVASPFIIFWLELDSGFKPSSAWRIFMAPGQLSVWILDTILENLDHKDPVARVVDFLVNREVPAMIVEITGTTTYWLGTLFLVRFLIQVSN